MFKRTAFFGNIYISNKCYFFYIKIIHVFKKINVSQFLQNYEAAAVDKNKKCFFFSRIEWYKMISDGSCDTETVVMARDGQYLWYIYFKYLFKI